MAEFSDAPPTDIDPYQVLELETSATPSEVKSAYKKLALRHHPDKAHPNAKHAAHTKFQEIACAYAILSDERRRKRYDTTGNTAESLDIDDDVFNWTDFFRAQWAEAVTGERLDNFKSTYQNSDEEKRDVLTAYRSSKGKLNSVFNAVMLSNPLDDEDRFRGYIDQAIEDGDVEAYDAYVHEPKAAREKRIKRAKKESEGAKKHAKTLGVYDSLFGDGKAGRADNASKKAKTDVAEPDLAALLQQRAKGRAATFLDSLEAKYTGGKNGKKQKAVDEPSEEAFQKAATRMKKRKARVIEDEEERDDEDEIDLEQDSPVEEPVAPTRRRKSKRSKRSKR